MQFQMIDANLSFEVQCLPVQIVKLNIIQGGKDLILLTTLKRNQTDKFTLTE